MIILDADKKYMYPEVGLMRQWFDEFNKRFFDNKLPPVEIKVIWGEKNTLGGFWRPERRINDPFRPEDCAIVFNCRFFEPEDEWRNIMVHEMVHYDVYMVYGTCVKSHGKEFKAIARRINASSEFEIDTYTRNKSFRPKPSTTDHWGDRFDEEIILGSYWQTALEDFSDEDIGVSLIEIRQPGKGFSFRTKRRYIPEIIDNMRSIRGEIEWYQVDECCQKLFLLPITTAVPSFKPEDIYHPIIDEADVFDDFGPIKWTHLGTTEFREDGVKGFKPGNRRNDFRQKFYRDAEEIGRLAADRLVKQYKEHSRWFTSTIHGTHNIKPSSGEYTIQVDSRFKPLVAMTPKRILVNPVPSDLMMEAVKEGDTEKLAREITRVILSRRDD